jgi:hypothetical protein
MAALDTFIHQQAAPLLSPGERVQGVGCLLRVTALTRTIEGGLPVQRAFTHEPWLVALTQTRMILFLTRIKLSFASGAPECLNMATVLIPLDSLRHAKLEPIHPNDPARRLTLAFHQDLVPRGLGMLGDTTPIPANRFSSREHPLVLDLAPVCPGLDGQALLQAYASALADNVADGAFPMTPATLAQAAAAREERAHHHAEQARLAAERAELRRRDRPRRLRNLGLLALGATGMTLLYFTQLFVNQHHRYIAMKRLPDAAESMMIAATCGFGVLLTLVLVAMLWRRKLPVVSASAA